MKNRVQSGDALLIVDAQVDFFPQGALPVKNGDKIVPIVNEWIQACQEKNIPIFASRDWHPADHCSFKRLGGLWPDHCVQDTHGAQIHPSIQMPKEAIIINKADTPDVETYSAFEGRTKDGSTLDTLLRQQKIHRLWIVGLALDYCVVSTALAAISHGYETHLIPEGTRAISQETGDEALNSLQEAGAVIETHSHPYE